MIRPRWWVRVRKPGPIKMTTPCILIFFCFAMHCFVTLVTSTVAVFSFSLPFQEIVPSCIRDVIWKYPECRQVRIWYNGRRHIDDRIVCHFWRLGQGGKFFYECLIQPVLISEGRGLAFSALWIRLWVYVEISRFEKEELEGKDQLFDQEQSASQPLTWSTFICLMDMLVRWIRYITLADTYSIQMP